MSLELRPVCERCGAPLAVDSDSFRSAGGDLEGTLRTICERVHAYGDVLVGGAAR